MLLSNIVLNPEITFGNLLMLGGFIVGFLGLWYKMKYSVDALVETQREHSVAIKNLVEDRTAIALMNERMGVLDQRLTLAGARADDLHKRIHIAELELHSFDVMKADIEWLKNARREQI